MNFINTGAELGQYFQLLPSLPLNQGPEVSLRDNFRIKDVCRYALEHNDGLMRLFSLKQKGIFPAPFPCRPRISATHCASPEVPLDLLFAVDQKANLTLHVYGKSGQPLKLTFGRLVNK